MARKRKKHPLNKPIKRAGIAQDGRHTNSLRQNDEEWSFIDLPGEIQNEVYQAVLDQAGAYLVKNLRIAMPTSLSLVSKEIRAQLLEHAMYSVTARVTDYNFRDVITFLNRLPEEDIGLLRSKTENPNEPERKPKLNLELVFSGQFRGFPRGSARGLSGGSLQHTGLPRWLNRFSVPSKRASNLELVYTPTENSMHTLGLLSRSCELYLQTLQDGKGKDEMRKIHTSLMQQWRSVHATQAEHVREMAPRCSYLQVQNLPSGTVLACGHCSLARTVQMLAPPLLDTQ